MHNLSWLHRLLMQHILVLCKTLVQHECMQNSFTTFFCSYVIDVVV